MSFAVSTWTDAAREYLAMTIPARANYRNSLSIEQRRELDAEVFALQATLPKKTGCSRPIAIGCIGMVLGAVVTIVGEMWAISAGYHAVTNNVVGRPSGPGDDPIFDPCDPRNPDYDDPDVKAHCAMKSLND